MARKPALWTHVLTLIGEPNDCWPYHGPLQFYRTSPYRKDGTLRHRKAGAPDKNGDRRLYPVPETVGHRLPLLTRNGKTMTIRQHLHCHLIGPLPTNRGKPQRLCTNSRCVNPHHVSYAPAPPPLDPEIIELAEMIRERQPDDPFAHYGEDYSRDEIALALQHMRNTP